MHHRHKRRLATALGTIACTWLSIAEAAPIDTALRQAWEQRMLSDGPANAQTVLDSSPAANTNVVSGHCYYDGGLVYREIAEYTGDDTFLAASDRCVRDYVQARRPSGNGAGYNRFPRGLARHFLAGGNQAEPNDLELLRSGSGQFTQLEHFQGEYCGTCTNTHRELAYLINSEVEAERVGHPRNTAKLRQLLSWAESQMWQMHTGNYIHHGRTGEHSYHFYQPFMRGLMWDALQELVEWERYNGRDPDALWSGRHWPTITTAISSQAIYLKDTARIVRGEGVSPQEGRRIWDGRNFAYIDRCIYGEIGGGCEIYHEVDLNMLLAPTYAWLCRETGNARFARDHDEIVAGSLGWYAQPKQFNQQFLLGIKGMRWRDSAACAGGAPPVTDPGPAPGEPTISELVGTPADGEVLWVGGPNLPDGPVFLCYGGYCRPQFNTLTGYNGMLFEVDAGWADPLNLTLVIKVDGAFLMKPLLEARPR